MTDVLARFEDIQKSNTVFRGRKKEKRDGCINIDAFDAVYEKR